jgi:DNA polymerase III delta prime subunit
MIGQVLEAPVKQNPQLLQIEADDSISIEQIRQAQAFVRLKSTGKRVINRAILLLDAEKLTIEAQNAFLKLLEEPPADTVIVLTASDRQKLLPTILSRAAKIQLNSPPPERLVEHFSAKGFDKANITAMYHMSGGLPGLMASLLEPSVDDPLAGYITEAKQLLQQANFDKLIFVDQFVKTKKSLANLLWALKTISQAGLALAIKKDQRREATHWRDLLIAVNQAQSALGAHPQPNLLLTNLVMHL